MLHSVQYNLISNEAEFICLQILALDDIRNEIIGDEEVRGISGGQRKRVNVGLELVADPIMLFLDEPTSGLDSTSSKMVVSALQQVQLIPTCSGAYHTMLAKLLRSVKTCNLRANACCPVIVLQMHTSIVRTSTAVLTVSHLQSAHCFLTATVSKHNSLNAVTVAKTDLLQHALTAHRHVCNRHPLLIS